MPIQLSSEETAIAAALAEARRTATALDAERFPGLTVELGMRVGRGLYDELLAAGATPAGAKIGATDAAAQARLGLDHPFAAPLLTATLLADGARLSLGELVAPLVEAEIGLWVEAGEARPVACVEVADSRFAWAITLAHAHADYGCQGWMLLGEPRDGAPTDGVVHAVVRRDGDQVADGAGPVGDAEARLWLVEEHLAAVPEGRPAFVATGSLTPPVPLATGSWTFDFGDLGSLSLEVAP